VSVARPADVLLCTTSRHARPGKGGACALAPGCPEPAGWVTREHRTGCTRHTAAWIRRNHPADKA
jgi:hypothetical protein